MVFSKFLTLFLAALTTSVFSQSVLILQDGSTEDSVQTILADQGIAATLGGNFWEYTGVNIQNYKLVILLNGFDYDHLIADSVQTRIRDFVANGGNLLTTEWLAYYAHNFPILSEVFPVKSPATYGQGVETYRKAADHPICAGLSDSFSTRLRTYGNTTRDTAAAKQAVTLYTGSLSGDAVVLGVYGSGEVLHWNMGGHYGTPDVWNMETKKLLTNIVQYLSGDIRAEQATRGRATYPLLQNLPNPFNRATTFHYPLAEAGRVSLKVYDLTGREVVTLVNASQNAGLKSVEFNAANLGTGVYYCRLLTGRVSATQRLVIIR